MIRMQVLYIAFRKAVFNGFNRFETTIYQQNYLRYARINAEKVIFFNIFYYLPLRNLEVSYFMFLTLRERGQKKCKSCGGKKLFLRATWFKWVLKKVIFCSTYNPSRALENVSSLVKQLGKSPHYRTRITCKSRWNTWSIVYCVWLERSYCWKQLLHDVNPYSTQWFFVQHGRNFVCFFGRKHYFRVSFNVSNLFFWLYDGRREQH